MVSAGELASQPLTAQASGNHLRLARLQDGWRCPPCLPRSGDHVPCASEWTPPSAARRSIALPAPSEHGWRDRPGTVRVLFPQLCSTRSNCPGFIPSCLDVRPETIICDRFRLQDRPSRSRRRAPRARASAWTCVTGAASFVRGARLGEAQTSPGACHLLSQATRSPPAHTSCAAQSLFDRSRRRPK